MHSWTLKRRIGAILTMGRGTAARSCRSSSARRKVSRGSSSRSALNTTCRMSPFEDSCGKHQAVLRQLWEMMQFGELPWRLLTLYDFDKSGEDIENAAMSRLRAFGGDAEWTSERIAVTPDQVDELKLPMRPEKRGIGEAVELDAIPPDVLAEIVEKAIQSCIPEDIEDQRQAARSDAREAHYNTVEEMVTKATKDYEPQRNEEMQRYVKEQQPKFERLRQEFKRDAPE